MYHPYIEELQATGKYNTLFPYSDGQLRPSFTGDLLMQAEGGIRQNPPVLVSTVEEVDNTGISELFAFFHLGEQLTGHSGIVHGGLLATLLDECLCRCGFTLLPHKVGVTAKLEIDYLAPTPSSSLLCLRAKTVKVEGRKVWVEGETHCLCDPGEYHKEWVPKPTMRAKLLAVEPKWHEKLKGSAAADLNSTVKP